MQHQIQRRERDKPLHKKLSTQIVFGKEIHSHRLSNQMKSERLKKTFFKYFFKEKLEGLVESFL